MPCHCRKSDAIVPASGVADTSGVNGELVNVFLQMKEVNKDNMWKAKANEKVRGGTRIIPRPEQTIR